VRGSSARPVPRPSAFATRSTNMSTQLWPILSSS
jgi:hypothetical protein